jgi:hypothetical protein
MEVRLVGVPLVLTGGGRVGRVPVRGRGCGFCLVIWGVSFGGGVRKPFPLVLIFPGLLFFHCGVVMALRGHMHKVCSLTCSSNTWVTGFNSTIDKCRWQLGRVYWY